MTTKIQKYLAITPIAAQILCYENSIANIKQSYSDNTKEKYATQQISDTLFKSSNIDNIFILDQLNKNGKIILNNQSTSIDLLIDINESNISSLRNIVKEKIYEQCGAYVFGSKLDTITQKIKKEYLNSNREINEQVMEKNTKKYSVDVPNMFKQKDIDFYFIANKTDLTLKMYSTKEKEPLLDIKIAVGKGKNGNRFDTPTGEFYLKRIIQNPLYYPPKWSGKTHPEKPGPYNSYGLWMSELCKDSLTSNYEFSPKNDSGYRIHSTNNPKSIGSKTSHGCIRIHPDNALEMFNAILEYSPHKISKKNGRGTIYPLDKPIEVTIAE